MSELREFKINKNNLTLYRDYQYDRSNIYYKKEILKEPKPWTQNFYLQNYKFTNVHRRTDKESKFLISSVCENTSLSLEDKFLNCALFRFINCESGCKYLQSTISFPVNFSSLPDDLDWNHLCDLEDTYSSQEGVGVMQSNAYFLSLIRKVAYNQNPSLRGSSTALCKYVFDNKDVILKSSNLCPMDSIKLLKSIKGFGEFFAYQIWEDWTYIPEYHHHDNDYVNCGPGAIEGIDWLIDNLEITEDNQVKYNVNKWTQEDYNNWIRWFSSNIVDIMKENGLEFNPKAILHYMDEEDQIWSLGTCQNSFCEFNKLNKLIHKIPMRVRNYAGNID